MITADTITDEQIREMKEQARRNHSAHGLSVSSEVFDECAVALSSFHHPARRREARQRCAEILNARSGK